MKLASTGCRIASPVLLGVLIAAAYLGNGETLGSGDTLPARQLPVRVLLHGDFFLDEFRSEYHDSAEHSVHFVHGHWVSSYPVGAAILALPFYAPSTLGGSTPDPSSLERLEKTAATGIALLSAAVLLLTLRRLTTPGVSLAITAVYALGTSTFSTSSQALWQHGPAQLAVSCALYCLVRGARSPMWLAFSGFPMAFAMLCRPTDALLVLPLALFVLFRWPRHFPALVACGLPVGAFVLWYNLTFLGTAVYSQFPLGRGSLWSTPFWEGFAGLLISPGRGLFVYSPILLFSIVGFYKAWRARSDDDVGLAVLRWASPGVVLIVLVHSRWWSWWGGVCFGPRLLADTLPVLCLALYPLADRVLAHRRWRVAAVALAAWSLAAHFIGAYWDDGRWNAYVLPDGLWSWSDSPLTNPPRELFNRVLIDLRDLPTSRSHPELLACTYPDGASPHGVSGRVREQIRVTVDAVNTGGAVWVAWPKRAKKSVRLLWELEASNGSGAKQNGRIALRRDVFPGGAYRFQIPVVLPDRPGRYEMRVDLVANRGPSFSDLGSRPHIIPVEVTPRLRK